jgi:hypothetical protein
MHNNSSFWPSGELGVYLSVVRGVDVVCVHDTKLRKAKPSGKEWKVKTRKGMKQRERP